jgi:predicted transcriptional regulator
MKTIERERARLLRREGGCSVKEIARIVGVSRSSVSLWIRDIELTPKQHAALQARNPAHNGQRVGAEVRARIARAGPAAVVTAALDGE